MSQAIAISDYRRKQIVYMREIEEFNSDEIARELGVHAGAVLHVLRETDLIFTKKRYGPRHRGKASK